MNKDRCILQASGMDKVYWGEALNYVVYTENRSPTKALGGKTPFEALYGRKPNIDHLRPFGCPAFAFIDKAKRAKLDPRAIKCVFVGYASQHKSYRLIDCDSGQLIQCRSVKFTEDSVPANDKKVQFNDQITTVPLQDFPSENVEVEDEEDVKAVSTHQQHSTQVSVGAPIVDTDRDPNVSSQPSEGQICVPLLSNELKQTMVSLSTAEAEYITLCDLVKELLWYIELLEELRFPQRRIVVHCDNQSAIAIAQNPGHHERTKHISTKYHFVRDQMEKGRIQLSYCPTKLIIADIFTNAIPRE
ncbi:Aste57867_15393 [Aphanomyces stellatus]|uniref:Aste57867_15393 protein n=1 Tax=Aphanomyces stellatus TaxID=120398 RepID=A0A485L3B0_9STRA|nr:hypothetical protein As57867_015337 [Aphanomyces stellatus]VFT92197.1 Aste57867_15393 [Aphanomyces stellatus]